MTVFSLMVPLWTPVVDAESSTPTQAGGESVEVAEWGPRPPRRADRLHEYRLRLNNDVSLGGSMHFEDLDELAGYTLNLRVTF